MVPPGLAIIGPESPGICLGGVLGGVAGARITGVVTTLSIPDVVVWKGTREIVPARGF